MPLKNIYISNIVNRSFKYWYVIVHIFIHNHVVEKKRKKKDILRRRNFGKEKEEKSLTKKCEYEGKITI